MTAEQHPENSSSQEISEVQLRILVREEVRAALRGDADLRAALIADMATEVRRSLGLYGNGRGLRQPPRPIEYKDLPAWARHEPTGGTNREHST